MTKYRYLDWQTSTTHFLHPLGNQSKRDYNCKLSLKLSCVLEVMQANSEANSSPAERVSSCVFIVELKAIVAPWEAVSYD